MIITYHHHIFSSQISIIHYHHRFSSYMMATRSLVWGLTLGSSHYTILNLVFESHSQQLGPKRNEFPALPNASIGLSKHAPLPTISAAPAMRKAPCMHNWTKCFPSIQMLPVGMFTKRPFCPAHVPQDLKTVVLHFLICLAVQEGIARSLWKTHQQAPFGAGHP